MGTLAGQIAASKKKRGTRCTFCTIYQQLDPDDQAALLAAMDDPNVEQMQIYRALVAEGHRITHDTVGRHYRGQCVTWTQVTG